MAALNLTPLTQAGAADSLAAATGGGDSFPLNQPIILTLQNGGAGERTVTAVAQNACNHGVLHNRVFAVPNDDVPYRALFQGSDLVRFADANGRLQLTYDDAAGLSVGATASVA